MCGDSGADDWSSRQVARTDQTSSALQPRGVGPILSTSINTHFERKEKKKEKKKHLWRSFDFQVWDLSLAVWQVPSIATRMTQSTLSFFVLFLRRRFHRRHRRHRTPAHILLAFQVRYEFQPTATIWTTASLQGEGGWNTTVRTHSLWACLKLDLSSLRLDVTKEDSGRKKIIIIFFLNHCFYFKTKVRISWKIEILRIKPKFWD